MSLAAVSFRTRRTVSIIVTMLAVALLAGGVWLETSRLGHASILSGATLLTCLLVLCLIGARRRLPVLPLGSVSTWTQVHIYTGIFASGAYVMHVPTLLANGQFEGGLSLLFLTVAASGIYGVFASRTLPKRLTAVNGQHRFDRVGWHRDQIAATAGNLLKTVDHPRGADVLAHFYQTYLQPFFESRPSFAYILVPSGMRRRRLLSGLQQLHRYLESDGRHLAGQFAALVRHRDDLDYQYALQLRLRVWLVAHSVLSVALVIGSIVHTFVALRFLAGT